MTTATGINTLRAHWSLVDVLRRRCEKPGRTGLIHVPEVVILVTRHRGGNSLSSYAATILSLTLSQKYLRNR